MLGNSLDEGKTEVLTLDLSHWNLAGAKFVARRVVARWVDIKVERSAFAEATARQSTFSATAASVDEETGMPSRSSPR